MNTIMSNLEAIQALIVGKYVPMNIVTLVTVVWVKNWYVVIKAQATEMYRGVIMVAFPKRFPFTLLCRIIS